MCLKCDLDDSNSRVITDDGNTDRSEEGDEAMHKHGHSHGPKHGRGHKHGIDASADFFRVSEPSRTGLASFH